MSNLRWVAIKTVKIIIGIVIGLVLGFVNIVCFEIFLPHPNPFRQPDANFWLIGPIIGGWVLVLVWLMLRKWPSKKIKSDGIEKLPASIGELISSIINSMGYRRSVRGEVQQELVDHFGDMMKDCQTDDAREKRAEEIISEFGDVKMLGRLIRRGKKRCRPLWRTMIVRCFQLIGVLILLLIIHMVLFITGKPDISIDYVARFNEMVRPVVDEELNAAPFYERAAELAVKKAKEMPDFSEKKLKELTADERGMVVEWVDSNKEALEQVRLGNEKPYYWKKYYSKTGEIINILLPGLGKSKNLGRALIWRALMRAEDGKQKEAFEDIKSCYKFGRHIKGGGTLIEQLVGIAIEAMAADTLRRVLEERTMDSIALADMQKGYKEMTAGEQFTVELKYEKLFIYDEIQRCYVGKRLGGLRAGKFCLEGTKRMMNLTSRNKELGVLVRMSLIPYPQPNREECREMVDRFYAYWEKIAQKSPAQIRAEGIDTKQQTYEMIKGNLLLEILTPALMKVCEISYRNRADVEATALVLAVLRYEKDKGGYPKSLAAVVDAGFLEDVPIDPFSGETLVYRKTEDGFILYSVGTNFTDDGGQYETDRKGNPRIWGYEGDAVFWPVLGGKH